MRGLSQSQIERLQQDAESLLERVGFRVQHAGLRQRAGRAGARVEEASGLVKLPGGLLRELLAQAPSQYEVAGITGRRWTVGGDCRHCLAIVTDPWIVDKGSGLPRRPCLEDVRRHTRIAQRLDEVAAISLMDYPVTDVEGPHSSLRALEAHLLEHDKHMSVLAVSPERLARWLRLLPVLTGGSDPGAPLVTAGVAVLSPLTLTPDNGELLLMACAHGFPVVPTVCPMAGTTSPYSKAGTLLQAHAEALFMAALTQLVRPGHPFLYIIGPSRTDMRSGADLYYTLDKVLWKIAGAQLGRACGLPSGAECGGTMVCRHDLQSGAEGMLFMLAAWQSGAHLLSGIGSCGNAVSMSGEMMVAQAAWLRAARFLEAGIDLEAYPGLESLQQVGPGGQFLDDELTLERLRSGEFFSDPLFDYEGDYLGTEPLLERARRAAAELSAGEDSPVPEEVREGIRRFFCEECCHG